MNARRLVWHALALGASAGLSAPQSLDGQALDHEHGEEHHAGLHFAHPMFTESVSPDTKIRINAARHGAADEVESEFEIEGEYAVHRAFSIEIAAPVIFRDPQGASGGTAFGNLEIMFKFANYAFEHDGLLLGYGVEFTAPTGSDAKEIGSSHLWSVEPLLNIGFKRGKFELVAFARFGIPFNQAAGEAVETELAFEASGLVHISRRFQALAEARGETILSGAEAGSTVTAVAGGGKWAPIPATPLFIGMGVRTSLANEDGGTDLRASLFYHF